MKIERVLCAPGMGGFFYDDQTAIRNGVVSDGFCYLGAAKTPGFSAIRMPAETLSVGLVLSDGQVAWGDMMSVQYAGGSGRDPVFRVSEGRSTVREVLEGRATGFDLDSFREGCATLLSSGSDDRRLPLALEYGVSQALLRGVALVKRRTMAEVICEEYALPLVMKAVPLYAQSGDAREVNVDKMILKGVDVLPHGLINSREKFGEGGETFLEYVNWVRRRAAQLGGPGYVPRLHFDVYGWIGLAFGLDIEAIAAFIARAEKSAEPYRLHIESPADFGGRDEQIEGFAALRRALRRIGSEALIVADEWCNTLDDVEAFAQRGGADIVQIKMPDVGSIADTIEAALTCKRHGVGAYVGGSCVETDLSAQVSAHVALALQADMVLAKPGMGVDEGLMVVGNEQSRLLALLGGRDDEAKGGACLI